MWLTDHTNMHACVCTQWHHQNFWTGRFFLWFIFSWLPINLRKSKICTQQKFLAIRYYIWFIHYVNSWSWGGSLTPIVLSLNYQYYHQYRHHKGEDCSLLNWYPATEEDVAKKVRESLVIKSFIKWWVNLASAAGCFAIPCTSKTLPSTRLDHQLENLLNQLMSMCIQPTWRFYCFSQTFLPLF